MSERHSVKVAVFILLEREGRIFIIKRANTGWADGMWTVPSGHVEKGETVLEAAVKETREEAGIIVSAENLEFVHVHAVSDAYVNFYFRTSIWEGEPYLAEPSKCSDVAWVLFDEVPEDSIMQVRSLLKQMKLGTYFSEIINDPKASE